MKIIISEEQKKQELLKLIEKCKLLFGDNCEYSVEEIEKIIANLKELLKTIDNDRVKIIAEVATCGIGKKKAKVNATSQSKIFDDVYCLTISLKVIIDMAKVNNMKIIHGFNFTEKQIDLYIKNFMTI